MEQRRQEITADTPREEIEVHIRKAQTNKLSLEYLAQYVDILCEEKRNLAKETVVQFVYGGEEARIAVQRTLSEADGLEEAASLIKNILKGD